MSQVCEECGHARGKKPELHHLRFHASHVPLLLPDDNEPTKILRNPQTEQFQCPTPGCTKSYPFSFQLAAHFNQCGPDSFAIIEMAAGEGTTAATSGNALHCASSACSHAAGSLAFLAISSHVDADQDSLPPKPNVDVAHAAGSLASPAIPSHIDADQDSLPPNPNVDITHAAGSLASPAIPSHIDASQDSLPPHSNVDITDDAVLLTHASMAASSPADHIESGALNRVNPTQAAHPPEALSVKCKVPQQHKILEHEHDEDIVAKFIADELISPHLVHLKDKFVSFSFKTADDMHILCALGDFAWHQFLRYCQMNCEGITWDQCLEIWDAMKHRHPVYIQFTADMSLKHAAETDDVKQFLLHLRRPMDHHLKKFEKQGITTKEAFDKLCLNNVVQEGSQWRGFRHILMCN
ncbi:uncharacterized protein LAESUDRAFT_713556 [Laetiporus sulphureus 93-53]|uniref:Uncharacterized protein n=1 Tax=Laetiporus sulphureus 93-53 TaxID=1314785 RepID=A0A165ENQ8_9APHY|nr:uncharacterized protein LAESUDRAFT_713556 [Laetiporus sulphureus 93-53]KZT07445.1 hypothetical protein LAESUDRAFT_713556 [Laetiporus sulphureus 93-53]